tara:strand:+ start:184 stop:366 length:183 start_codon:yes stop_codon:yes gene_type:complete
MVFDMHDRTTPEQAKRNRERDDQNKRLQAGIRTVRGNGSTEEAQGGTERREAVRSEEGDG